MFTLMLIVIWKHMDTSNVSFKPGARELPGDLQVQRGCSSLLWRKPCWERQENENGQGTRDLISCPQCCVVLDLPKPYLEARIEGDSFAWKVQKTEVRRWRRDIG